MIEESITAHLVSDVPVSSFLSGGLDSSIITVLAHRANPAIDAYTIAFRAQDQRLEAMPDDAVYARKVAARFGIKLHEIEISPDVVAMLPRIVNVLDEPIGDPAAINTLLMCDSARERGVKVVLSGMGADELFGGYRKHLACVLASKYSRTAQPGPRRRVGGHRPGLPVVAAGRGLRYARWAKRFLTFADLPEEPRFRAATRCTTPEDLSALLSPDLARHVESGAGGARRHLQRQRTGGRGQPDVPGGLAAVPAGSQPRLHRPGQHGRLGEVRVPFVDPVVARAAFSIPGRDKIRRRQGKVALKRAAEAWLPNEIVHRPKASFSAPLRAWVQRRPAGGYPGRASRRRARGVRDDPPGRAVAAHRGRAGRARGRSKQIWQLLTLELWYRHAQSMGVAS